MAKVYLEVGDLLLAAMPYSEVCMYMKVAGQMMIVERLNHGAQLYSLTPEEGCPRRDRPFSFPITYGEAGLFTDSDGVYGYGEKLVPEKERAFA